MSVTKVSADELAKVIVYDIERGEHRVRGTGPDIRFPNEALRSNGLTGAARADVLTAVATLVCIRARAERKRRRARRKARRGWA